MTNEELIRRIELLEMRVSKLEQPEMKDDERLRVAIPQPHAMRQAEDLMRDVGPAIKAIREIEEKE